MNAPVKTHYRKAFQTKYLSSADLTDSVILTISKVVLEADKTKRSSKPVNTAYFNEKEIRQGEALKPMILNATNCKMLAAITGSPYLDDWKNVPVVVHVVKGIRFGNETVDGLRIGRIPQEVNQQYKQKPFINEQGFENACKAIAAGTHTIEQIMNKYSLSEHQISHLQSLSGS
ncbi:hypothetical protein KC099_11135 [Acinetobacter nosocomialis]|uniref:hypothetical protein n=1 Tax=Acinetobacter nosocomialis TaxID=106654 RepID=UPI001B8171B1|nr:hypothetical protein [Acinetobacter nosocomialis]MBR7713750.1 hypothetical protein [Acinetobacter nosocomialis]